MEIEGIIVWFVIVFILVTGGFYFFITHGGDKSDQETVDNQTIGQDNSNVTSNEENQTDENITAEQDEFGDNFSGVEELHWDHMPLNYIIINKSACSGLPLQKLQEAFGIVESETGGLVKFSEMHAGLASTADIVVYCVNPEPLIKEIENKSECDDVTFDHYKSYFDPLRDGVVDESDYVTEYTLESKNVTKTVYEVCYAAGDGSAAQYISELKEKMPEIGGGLITKATLKIYVSGKGINSCADFPSREVHQILHSLGFDHGNEPAFDPYYGWSRVEDKTYLYDVMFRDINCVNQKGINPEYVSCLKKIYSNGDFDGDCADMNFL